jgi:hypothetical protein
MLPGRHSLTSPAMVLPIQRDQVTGDPLDGLARLGGQLVHYQIIDRSGRGGVHLNATREGTCISQERLFSWLPLWQ